MLPAAAEDRARAYEVLTRRAGRSRDCGRCTVASVGAVGHAAAPRTEPCAPSDRGALASALALRVLAAIPRLWRRAAGRTKSRSRSATRPVRRATRTSRTRPRSRTTATSRAAIWTTRTDIYPAVPLGRQHPSRTSSTTETFPGHELVADGPGDLGERLQPGPARAAGPTDRRRSSSASSRRGRVHRPLRLRQPERRRCHAETRTTSPPIRGPQPADDLRARPAPDAVRAVHRGLDHVAPDGQDSGREPGVDPLQGLDHGRQAPRPEHRSRQVRPQDRRRGRRRCPRSETAARPARSRSTPAATR